MLLTHINIACTHKFSNAALQQIPSEKYISCHLKKITCIEHISVSILY